MRKSYILYVIAIIGGLLISCTREIDESVNISIDTSQLSKGAQSSPNSQSLIPAGYYPKVLLANLHYDGKTEVVEWECNDSIPASSCAYPSNVNFGNKKFPNGTGRIAQVLLVYENDNEQLLFFYAHALNINFSGGTVNVTINNWINNGASPGSGNISGRFFDGTETNPGPTGKLIGTYSPPRPSGYTEAQIPDMKLFKRYMFNGYFDVFFVRGSTKFSWYLANDATEVLTQKVFDKLSFDDFDTSLNPGTSATKVQAPEYYHVWLESPSVHRSHYSMGEENIIGFFNSQQPVVPGLVNYFLTGAPGPAKGFVFKNLADQTPSAYDVIQNAYRRYNGADLFNPIDYTINPITGWVVPPGTSSSESAWTGFKVQVVYSGGTPNDIYVSGGQTTDTGGCGTYLASGFVSATCIKVMPGLTAMQGVTPFRGPFAMRKDGASAPYNYSFINVGAGAIPGDTKIKWKYLPGVLNPTTPSNALVSGTDVFVVNRAVVEHENEEEGMNCAAISALNPTLLGNISSQDDLSQTLEFNNSAVAAFVTPEILLCPYKLSGSEKKYYPFGIATQHFQPMIPPPGITVSMSLAAPAAPIGIPVGCTALTVAFSGGTTTADATLNFTGTGINFSNSAGCGTPYPNSHTSTVTAGNPGPFTYYVSANDPTDAVISLSVTSAGADSFTVSSSPSINFYDPITVTSSSAATVPEDTCIPITINRTYATGSPSISISNTSNTGKYYSSVSCTGGSQLSMTGNAVNTAFGGGLVTKTVYYKAFISSNSNETFTVISGGAPPDSTLNRSFTDSVKYVFISAIDVAGDFASMSPDTYCTTAANSNRIGGSYLALVSTAAQSAKAKIEARGSNSKQYVLFDNNQIALNKDDFFDLDGCSNTCISLIGNIDYTETFTVKSSVNVRTGTMQDGTTSSGYTCSDWSATLSTSPAGSNSNPSGGTWINSSSQTCATALPVYCVEDGP